MPHRARLALPNAHFTSSSAARTRARPSRALAAGAAPLLREALEIERDALGPRHERVAYTLRVLGDAAAAGGRRAEALGHYTEALRIARDTLGPQHKEIAVLQLRMGRVHQALGQMREAEDDYRAAAAGFQAALGAPHPLTAEATLALAGFWPGKARQKPRQ